MSEASRTAVTLGLLGRDVLAELDSVAEPLLNQPMSLPEANSLFAIATHLVAAGESWVLQFVGGRPVQRDRPAEFRATGSHAEIRARYERWIAAVHEVLDTLPDSEMERGTDAPLYRDGLGVERLTVRDCLLHAVDHTALHLGHVQITRQVLQTQG